MIPQTCDNTDLLRTVVQATGAKVVLSTDWRRIPKLKQQLIQTLHDYGMVVIGATPMRAPWQPVRPQEILEFLTAYNQGAAANGVEPIASFVAVDDRSLLNESGGEGLRGETPCSDTHCNSIHVIRTATRCM